MTEDQQLRAAQLEHERLAAERDRLRAARAFFARQLGPLPAVGGLSLSTAGLLVGDIAEWGTLVSLGIVAAIVAVGTIFAGMKPYRTLRTEAENKLKASGEYKESGATEAEWYEQENKIERSVYPDLEKGMDRERLGLFLTQGLLVALAVVLVLAHTGGD